MNRNKTIFITAAALLSICLCFAIMSKVKKIGTPRKPISAPSPPIKNVKKAPRAVIIQKDNVRDNIKDIINSYPEGKARKAFIKDFDSDLEIYIEKLTKELGNVDQLSPEDSSKVRSLEDLKKMREALPQD